VNRTGIALLSGGAVALLAGVALLQKGEPGDPGPKPPVLLVEPESGTAPAPQDFPIPVPPAQPPSGETPAGGSDAAPPPHSSPTKIAPGTPEMFRRPYLLGYTPTEILEDGTQIYENIPFYVPQPDGTTKVHAMTVRIAPTDPLPILPEDLPQGNPPR
jgi:hypothetical protein